MPSVEIAKLCRDDHYWAEKPLVQIKWRWHQLWVHGIIRSEEESTMLTRILSFINKIITLDGRLIGLELNLADRYKASLFVGRNDGHSVTFSAMVTFGAWAVPIGSTAGSIYTYLDLEISLGVISFALSLYRTNQPKLP